MARSTERVTADELGLAATWLESYNDGDEHHQETGEHDEAAATMFKVARWLRREERRRNPAAELRELVELIAVELIAERCDVKPDDPRVVAAARRTLGHEQD